MHVSVSGNVSSRVWWTLSHASDLCNWLCVCVLYHTVLYSVGRTWWLSCKKPPAMQETPVQFWVGKFPWRRAWPPTPSSCLENPHGQRSLAGYSPWGQKESDMIKWLNTAQHCIEYSIFISSPGCPEASIQAGVYSHCVSWVARLTSLDLETHSQNGTQSCIEDLLYWNEDDHCCASVFQGAFWITSSLFAVNWNSLKSMQKTECR